MTATLAPSQLIALLLASIRAVAWLIVCPPFNGRAVPMTVKGLLAIAMVLPLSAQLSEQSPSLDTWAIVGSALEQVVVGAGLGFLTAVIFAGIQAAGDLIDIFGGFSMAFAFDPMSFSGNNSVIGRFYGMLATTLLFTTDAHQLIIRGFTLSYSSIPLDAGLSLDTLATLLTEGLGELFLSAVLIAGPLIVVLFCADIGLGLLNRIAPALNPFQIGFPGKIALTLIMVGLAIVLLPQAVHTVAEHAASAVMEAIGR